MNAMYTLDELTNEQAVGVNVFVAQLCRRLEILRCGPDIDTFTPGQLIDCLIVAIGESVGSPTDGSGGQMMECFGGGIRHTLSRKCIEDGHHGAVDYYADMDKHQRTCAWVLYERQSKCDCSQADGGVEPTEGKQP